MCRHIFILCSLHRWRGIFPCDLHRIQIGKMTFPNYGMACSTRSWDHRGQSEMMEWKPCEPSKIKRTHRSRSFWSLRRRSQSVQRFTQDVDDVPEMLHRRGEGFHGIVVLQDGSHRQARQGSVAFMIPQRQILVLQVRQFTVKLAS